MLRRLTIPFVSAILLAALAPRAVAQAEAVVFVPELAAVRAGPGTVYDRLGELTAGQTAPALGRSPLSDWIQIGFNGGAGWVYAPFVELQGATLDSLPVIDPPPTPTLPPTPAGEGLPAGTPPPTRPPTFTPPPPVTIPTYANPSAPHSGFASAPYIIALFVVGLVGAALAIVRRFL